MANVDVSEELRPRFAPTVPAARYAGRGRTAFLEHVAPHLHPIRLGADKLWDLNEVDELMERLKGEAVRPMPKAARKPRRGRPAGGGTS